MLPADKDDTRETYEFGRQLFFLAMRKARNRRQVQPFGERLDGLEGTLTGFAVDDTRGIGGINDRWSRVLVTA